MIYYQFLGMRAFLKRINYEQNNVWQNDVNVPNNSKIK